MLFQRTKLIILSALLFFVPLNSIHAQGEEDQGLAIRPAIVDEIVTPGETKIIIIEIENITKNIISIEAGVEPMEVNEPIINNTEKTRYDVSEWIEFEQYTWALDAYENKLVKISITPPLDATPGGHYAQIRFRAIDDLPTSGSSTAEVIPQLNSLLLLTIPGDVIQDISISSFKINDFQVTPSFDAKAQIINNGNAHEIIRVTSRLQIGEDITTVENDARVILPGTIQTYPIVFDKTALLSRATAWTEITYGSPSKTLTSEKVKILIVSPYLLLIILFSLAAAGSFIGKGSKKKVYSSNKKRGRVGRKYSHPKSSSEKRLIKSGR